MPDSSRMTEQIAAPEPWGYFNGQFLPVSALKISVFDQGVVHGVAVTEMLRTFAGQLYEREAHLQRFQNSARLCRIPLQLSPHEMGDLAEKLVQHNRSFVAEGQELGLIISATPGLNPTYTGEPATIPTFYMHTFELPGELWAKAAKTGIHLAVSQVQQVPQQCVPVEAKTRSRMAWYLADAEVNERYPGARAIVLDQYGYVRETSTANLFVVRGGKILTPPADTVLPGISRAVALQLAAETEMPAEEIPITIDDLLQAEEIFVTSTPYCLLGVSRLNSTAVGRQFPGPVTQQLLVAWNQKLGLDIHEQLRTIAQQRSCNSAGK